MNPDSNEIFVERVGNGWVISAGRDMRCGNTWSDRRVARTPQQLADLIAEWSTQQQDKTPPPAPA